MKKKTLIRLLVICHLFVVTFGASHVFEYFDKDSIMNKTLNIYNNLSYAGANFPFFANVGLDTKLAFIKENGQKELEPTYFNLSNTQTAIRLIGMKVSFHRDTVMQDLLALSWGVNILNNNIEAEKVHVAVDVRNFPTMKEYNCGKVPNWEQSYYTLIEIN